MNLETERYWLEPTEGGERLGLRTDAAEAIKGDWVALELAKPGTRIRAGESFGFLTTGEKTHDFRSPWEFIVLARNEAAIRNPELARLSPRWEGWLIEIKRD